MDLIFRAICFGIIIANFIFSFLLEKKWIIGINFLAVCLSGAILLLGIYFK